MHRLLLSFLTTLNKEAIAIQVVLFMVNNTSMGIPLTPLSAIYFAHHRVTDSLFPEKGLMGHRAASQFTTIIKRDLTPILILLDDSIANFLFLFIRMSFCKNNFPYH